MTLRPRNLMIALGLTVAISSLAIARGLQLVHYSEWTEAQALLRLWPLWAATVAGVAIVAIACRRDRS